MRIDPEIRDLIAPLTPDVLAGLEADIAAKGCLDPLKVWAEHYGDDYTETSGCGVEAWEQVPGDERKKLCFPDEPGRPTEERTAAEWITLQGRGWHGSTEY